MISLNNSSGHYGSPDASLLRMIRFLTKHGADLSHLSEISVVGQGDVLLQRFHSVTEFLSSVKSLSGSSKVELLTLLKMMQDLRIRIDDIHVEDMPFNQFLSSLRALDTSSDGQDLADMVHFLKAHDFDFTQLEIIETVPALICMPLVKQIPVEGNKIEFCVRNNLKPLEIELLQSHFSGG